MTGITGNEIGLAGIIATALVGIAAVLGQLFTTNKTVNADRALAQDQRLWDKRSTLYVEVLALTLELNRSAIIASTAHEANEIAAFATNTDEMIKYDAAMQSYTGTAALTAWTGYINAILDCSAAISHNFAFTDNPEAVIPAIEIESANLGNALRAELQGEPITLP